MLFVLTGDIQTGKTRWLEKVVSDLQGAGATVAGVLAPGIWKDRNGNLASHPHADENGFEKLGIENVLLPSGERIAFASRADLAALEDSYDASSQSAEAKLGWQIDETAIRRVNDHFAAIRAGRESDETGASRMLVIDELGRLELERGGGLAQAVALLEDGPAPGMRHALVVVRRALLPHVESRFERWGEKAFIGPDEKSRTLILRTVAQSC